MSVETIELSNGKFVGETMDGVPVNGTLNYTNRNVFKGSFKSGSPDEGTMIYNPAKNYVPYYGSDRFIAQYTGHWLNGMYHGEGKAIYKDGSDYEGDWLNGMPRGKGKLTYKNGSVYEGDWFDGKRNGEGTMTYRNSDKAMYVGNWLSGEYNGIGTLEYVDGSVYKGNWRSDKYNGKGTLRYADRSVYEGDWLNGKYHGTGTLRYANGDSYEAVWKYGKRQNVDLPVDNFPVDNSRLPVADVFRPPENETQIVTANAEPGPSWSNTIFGWNRSRVAPSNEDLPVINATGYTVPIRAGPVQHIREREYVDPNLSRVDAQWEVGGRKTKRRKNNKNTKRRNNTKRVKSRTKKSRK